MKRNFWPWQIALSEPEVQRLSLHVPPTYARSMCAAPGCLNVVWLTLSAAERINAGEAVPCCDICIEKRGSAWSAYAPATAAEIDELVSWNPRMVNGHEN